MVAKLPAERHITFHTLSHELAHDLIHKKEMRKRLNKQQAETNAEAVAYVVSQYAGLEVGVVSSDYIQSYMGDETTLLESLSTVQKTAEKLIDALAN